jgi:predicted permease
MSAWAFRLLIRLYPAAFRDEYGRELALVFVDRYRDATGAWDRLRLWGEAIAGILVEAPKEHLRLLAQDLNYALRMLRHRRLATAAILLTLALGIGANSAIFSVLHALMFKPLPVRDPGQLVELLSRYPGEPRMYSFHWSHYEHYRDRNGVLAGLTGTSPIRFQVAGPGMVSGYRDGEYVVGNYFALLGLQPAIGRLIGPDDDRLGAGDPAVAVVSWRFWRTALEGSPAAVGRQIVLNGVPATIVGVTPRDFAGPLVGRTSDVWVPAAMEPLAETPSRRADGTLGLIMFGRLKDGVSVEAARAELSVLDRVRVEQIAARSNDPQWRQATLEVEHAGAGLSPLRDRFGTQLLVLLAIVGLLLLLACLNVASVLAARAAERQREMAIRRALGAGRVRLFRQLLTESLLLAAIGGLFGTGLSYVAARALVQALPVDPRSGLQRYEIPLEPDATVLLFTAGVSLLAALLFGLAPSWSGSRRSAPSSLRDSLAAAGRPSSRLFGKGLVVGQIALSVVVLSAAMTLVAHVRDLRERDLGFERESVLLVTLDPSRSGYSPDRLFAVYRDVLTRLEAIPSVRSAALAAITPIQGAAASRFVKFEGVKEDPDARRRASLNYVSPGYFATLGTRHIAGRDFSPRDEGGPRVAIVNGRLARQYFGDGSAVGRRFTLEGGDRTYEVVGVVADAKYSSLQEPAPPTIYLHAFQEGRGRFSQFAIRTSVEPTSLAEAVRHVVDDASEALPVSRMRTLTEQVDASIVLERLMAKLSGTFGFVGTVLGAIGIYGLLAYTIARRAHEIGIRMALGATSGDVIRMILKSAGTLIVAGLVLGLPLALWAQRLGASLIPDLHPGIAGPLVAAAMVVAAGLLAACGPASRAAHVAPADVLRRS